MNSAGEFRTNKVLYFIYQDFSERKRHEGEVSKVGSEEKVCLSPPWNEEEEELLAREVISKWQP